jgi:hypothetical protein
VLRAEHRAGELLRHTPRARGGGDQHSDQRSEGATGGPQTLTDLLMRIVAMIGMPVMRLSKGKRIEARDFRYHSAC